MATSRPDASPTGSIQTELSNHTFALNGGPAADGIYLSASGTGNSLTGAVYGATGHVTAPSTAIEVQSVSPTATPPGTDCGPYSATSGGGGSMDVTQDNDNITVRPPAGGNNDTFGVGGSKAGALHVPRHQQG